MQRSLLITLPIAVQMVWVLVARAGVPQPSSFTYNDFSNAGGLQLNGNSTNVVTGDGVVMGLTPADGNQKGSFFTADTVDLASNAGFSTFFTFRRSKSSATSPVAGMTFTLQNAGPTSLGGGLGYDGITNSLAVTFETMANAGNQIAVRTNGGTREVASAAVTNSAFNDGNPWYAWIDYDGVSSRLEARVTEAPVRPGSPTLATTVNLAAILGSISAPPTDNLLTNGGFEDEPAWDKGVSFDGSETALVDNEIPGWTIEPKHAVTIHKHPGSYLTITGAYSANADGEGWNGTNTVGFGPKGHNANFYQDFKSAPGLNYTLSFNWQSWGLAYPPTTNNLKISITDTLTGAPLFTGLYRYDGDGVPHPVHAVKQNFAGTGNPLRLRIEESPESGYNDNSFVVDDFKVVPTTPPLGAYVGFTGGNGIGGSQQDILAWKFSATPTLRMNGQLVLTNTPPGFSVSNGILVRKIRYNVKSVWYTNDYLYPLSFTKSSSTSVAFTSPAASGLTEGPNGEGQESAAIVAEYSAPTQSATPNSGTARPAIGGLIRGILMDVASPPLGGDIFKGMDPKAFESAFGLDPTQIQTVLSGLIAGAGSQGSGGTGSGGIGGGGLGSGGGLVGDIINAMSPILTSPAANLLQNVSGATFESMFPTTSESDMQNQMQNALNSMFNTVGTGFPPATEGLSEIINGGAQLNGGTVPLDIPRDNQPLIDALKQLLDTFNTPVEETPDYAFDVVTCSQATNVGFVTARKQTTLALPGAPELLSAGMSKTGFAFSFLTTANQSYTIWSSTNVAGPNWVSNTNITADGYLKTITVTPKDREHFFRISTP